jgi:acetoacetate decarboxylase
MTVKYNTDMNPAGMFNIFGRRPNTPYPPNVPHRIYRGGTLNAVTYRTSPEAIAAVLPDPLEPVPDMPLVAACLFETGDFHCMDGRNFPYSEFGMWVMCKYKNYVGMTIPFLYLDAEGLDIGMVSGRELFGYPKRHAYIHIYNRNNLTRATIVREGTPLVVMRNEIKDEISPSATPMAMLEYLIHVKEIPNCDFSGYDVRKVIANRAQEQLEFSRAWASEGSIILGHTDNEPLDILKVVEPGPCLRLAVDGVEGMPPTAFEIEDLLK